MIRHLWLINWEHPTLEETSGEWNSRLHKPSPPARTDIEPASAGFVFVAPDF
ncbi:hypothetical protein [Nostoc sp. T09]|uniref:hypothetical protein n=1 Tax=Nostoc sp. T09 TaxID=1932621 RepID=UPI0015C50B8B|nr:hypothetical protein [Nostoc sp. T09]